VIKRFALLFLAGMLLAACSSNPPKGLEDTLPNQPTQREAQAGTQSHLRQSVRWGGEILGVRNEPDLTDVELYARPLLGNAEPAPEGGEGVRFIARVREFLDPAEYQVGKRLTVRGTLAEPVTRRVGEYPYIYPVVEVEVFHLWPVYEPVERTYWRDPYYDPWWPWGPYGYRPYWW
jgi:outer membrane lipoprotein